MNLGVYESELSITRELLDNKLLECSEKLNKNPNDYQTLTELITISIFSGLNESALEFIDNAFKIYPHSSEIYMAKVKVLLQMGRIDEVKKEIIKFILNYKLDKNYKQYNDIFLDFSVICSKNFYDHKNGFELANKLVSISINEFPDDYRGYELKIINDMYQNSEFTEGRKKLKNLISRYNKISLVEAYIISFIKDDPQRGYEELKKLYPRYKKKYEHNLKHLEFRLISTYFEKNKIINFLNTNKNFFYGNYLLHEKLVLGCLDDKDLIEEKLINEYNKYLFNYKYQLNFNSRYLYFKDYLLAIILLAKKKEFQKKFKDEVELTKLARIERFKNKHYHLPSQSLILKKTMPLRLYNDQLEKLKTSELQKFKNDNINPIFIVGLPRTGSTLVEKIIQNPKLIFDCDESQMVNKLRLNLELNNGLKDLYKLYCQHYKDLKKFKYFTDKTLINFAFIDLITSIFPNAKFIHCTRDLRENIIGIFKQQFDNVPWSHTIQDILEYIDQYLKVMKIMNIRHSKIILEVNHTDLINNKEKETKKLFDFLDIKWNKDIFDFSKKETSTNTASKHQIKDGISKKYLNKYLDYYFILDEYKKKYSWLNY
jgi:hypothetical protein